MQEYTTKEFAAAVPCSANTIAKWRKSDLSKPLLAPDHFNKRGFPMYTEEQLPIARTLIKARKTALKAKETSTQVAETITPIVEHAEDTVPVEGKKIIATDDGDKDNRPKSHAQDTTTNAIKQQPFSQQVEYLPREILALPRFVKTRKDNPKAPSGAKWQDPKNQKLYSELKGTIGFVGSIESEDSLLFADFDHVLDDNDNFVSTDAQKWFEILHGEGFYCEKSQGGHGLHFFLQPTKGKFAAITGTRLYLTADKKSFIEIFYRSNRNCLVTGNLFQCEPNAPIAQCDDADKITQALIDALALQADAEKKAITKKEERKKLSPDIQALVDEINNVSMETLEAKGYLEHSEKGGNRPDGFICPWCGSGTRENKSGALTYYTDHKGAHVTCHACNCGGDILALFAKVNGYATQGEEFFQTVQLAADTFAIPYDEKIFEYHAEDNFFGTKDLIRDCPINLRLPQNFEFGKGGIKHITPPREGKDELPKIKSVTRTPLIITRVFTETKNFATQYEVGMRIGNKWRYVITDGDTLLDSRRVGILNGKGALIEENAILTKYFARLIALNQDIITRTRVYTQPGWHDGKFIYPISEGNDYICKRSNINYEELFATSGNAADWKDTLRKILYTGQAPLKGIVIGAALAAPLLKILHLPNFWLHIQGQRNYAKTPLLKFALSAYGNPAETYLLRSFDSSPKNRVTMAVAMNDLPQAIDELETLSPKETAELQKSVYDYCSGMDGQKNQKNGEVREVTRFRGVRISTGERPILEQNAKGGALKRCITLHVTSPLFDDETAHQLHRFCELNHGHFGRLWTEYISEHEKEILADYDRVLADNQRDTADFEPAHVRAIAACTVAFWHFRILLALEQSFDIYHAESFARLVIRDLPTKDDISDVKRGIELLASWIDSHPKNFIHAGKTADSAADSALSFTETSGILFSDGRVGFFAFAFRRICTEELHLPSYEKFLNELYDEGKLDCKSRSVKTQTCRQGREVKKIYLFKANVLIHIADTDGEEAEDLA